jgi:alpha-1,3-mannosyl-glycoprotein beta-1,2-N-acetylglucosaminyltransferase
MRLSDTRKGRESIRPEVCRTFNFGEAGSSKGQFYRTYLASIKRADTSGHRVVRRGPDVPGR